MKIITKELLFYSMKLIFWSFMFSMHSFNSYLSIAFCVQGTGLRAGEERRTWKSPWPHGKSLTLREIASNKEPWLRRKKAGDLSYGSCEQDRKLLSWPSVLTTEHKCLGYVKSGRLVTQMEMPFDFDVSVSTDPARAFCSEPASSSSDNRGR